jgi:hypothetical protein
MTDTSNVLLSPAELAMRWGRTSEYLADLRAKGTGPRFIRLSERVIRYKLGEIVAYEEANAFASNAEAMAADGAAASGAGLPPAA